MTIGSAATASSETLDRDAVVELAAEFFGWETAPYVARIVNCESTYRTHADTNYPYVGLMQIDSVLWAPDARRLFGSDNFYDPRVNMAMAAWLQSIYGWGAWPVCRFR